MTNRFYQRQCITIVLSESSSWNSAILNWTMHLMKICRYVYDVKKVMLMWNTNTRHCCSLPAQQGLELTYDVE